ncbi:MAG: SHOCT domain-containing protein [Chloroflexi bacterium]|nr:SHOCT domain-containing protein [Chloroflexota bacterium]
MMGPGMMGGFGLGGGFMGFGMILFWGLVIWAIVALVRGTTGSAGSRSGADSALDVLKRRYAQGDISKEEYEQKKKDLI